MRFANGQLTYLFLFLIGLAGLYLFNLKRKKALLKKYAEQALWPHLLSSFDQQKQNLRVLFILTAIFLIIIALLRPQWGFHEEDISRRGVDIFIAVDVSKSMLTQDVLPSRLGRAKLAIEDLVNQLKGDRIGLVAFAGSAFVQCPLTVDYDSFLESVEDLDVNLIPRGGTDIESAINEARRSFTTGSEGIHKTLIIITDGESHEGDAVAAAARAAQENITIHTIGLGTAEGDLIRVVDEQGSSGFLKNREGDVVKSRLNDDQLKQIAFKGNGAFVKATPTQFGLDLIYNNKISAMEIKEVEGKSEKRYTERYQIPLALALALLLLEVFIRDRIKNESD
ncbi:MAG: VWA domain-containing protein [Elusimicrobia bacterium]|nr:VWA domain-containing protein [Elusimicrobiota bacterium]